MNSNRKNQKIQIKKFWPKIEKKQGVPLDFFQFLAKTFLCEFLGFYD